MRTITSLMLLVLIFVISPFLYAGQIPSHIYTGANIRAANPSIEKYIATYPEAYLAGANGPDISNIMSILTKLSSNIGSESHYEKTGDLTIALLEGAETGEQKAFALGWMTHWVNDYFVHALVNQWGGWYEVADTRHKALEMLENKYVYSAKDIKKYNPASIPAAMEQDTYEAVYEAFKKTFPNKSKYSSSGARTDFLLWFRQANGHIRNASKSFMDAADNGTGKASDWITYEAFPLMPTEKQYQDIMKFAEIKDVSYEKGKIIVNIAVYDNKLHKWFLKQWDEAQTSATHYSVQVCSAAVRLLAAEDAQKKSIIAELSSVLPNVSIDQPRNDFDNSKIFPGNVDASEVYYECEITDTTKGANKFTVVKGTQPIDFSASSKQGFDGGRDGVVKLEIPVDSDSYKYDLKVSFKGKEVLADPDLKGYAWIGSDGVYGASVKIEGDNTVKAGSALKLKAVVEADDKTKPSIKLRWRNETAKTSLGEGADISFVSNEKGKATIKVEAYSKSNGKEIVYAEDAVDIDVTDPDVKIAIEGDTSIEPDKKLPLNVSITAEPGIRKALEIHWTDDSGKVSYGKGEKISFSANKAGSYSVRAEAFWKPDAKSDAVSVGSDSVKITVGAGNIKLKVDGKNAGSPLQPVPLKAVIEGIPDADKNGIEYVWNDETRQTEIGKGENINFTVDKAGTYVLNVKALKKSGDKSVTVAEANYTIDITTGTPGKGRITAKIAGLPTDSMQGASIIINAEDFRSGGEPYLLTDNDDETGSLVLKWSEYWKSTHVKECQDAEKQGTPVASIIPPRPNGWGVESIKVVWKSDPVLAFTPSDTLNALRTSAKINEVGKYTIWGELYLKTANGMQPEMAGETEKRILSVTPPVLAVELKASKVNLRPGEIVEVRVAVTGGKAPFQYNWTGDHAGDGAVVNTVSRKIGPLPLSVDVTDADGKKGSASITLKVNGVKAKLVGVENQVVYGTKSKFGNQIEGEQAPPQDDGLCEKCGQKKGTNKNCPYCVLSAHDPTKDTVEGSGPFGGGPVVVDKSVSTDGEFVRVDQPILTDEPDKAPTKSNKKPVSKDNPKEPKRMIIWQSEPALTFTPPKSPDGKTTVLYDRVGKVKIWTEILELTDGVYQTVGETEQVEIDVVPPAFNIIFDPETAKTGQEVKAVIKTSPEISSKLLNYIWFSPESSNRMEYSNNASEIGFKLIDSKPVLLKAEARVPYFGDTLSDNITATYTSSQYLMTTKVTGTKPRIWKEGVGLVDVENAYAVDQNVTIRAEFVDEKPAGDIRYQWTVNEGTSMGSSGLGNEITVSRHEVGTIEARVETRDPDGALLGKATAVVQITVSADDIKKAKTKQNPIAVVLTAPKTVITAGDSIKATAKVSGGTPPYTYIWTGECKPQGSSAVFTTKKTGLQPLTVTVKDSKGIKSAQTIKFDVKDPNLAVKLKIGKTSFVVNESEKITAEVTGGKPPYTYKWSPNIEGSGASPIFTAPNPGNVDVSVTVTDAKKKSVSAKVTLTVKELEATLEGLPEQVTYGAQISPIIRYPQSPAGSKVNASPLPTIYWKTNPEIKMQLASSDTPSNTLTFNRLGNVQIWGEVINRTGKLLGKTPVKTVNVTAPVFKMDITKMTEGRAYAKVTIPVGVSVSMLQFKWMRPTNGIVSGNGDTYEFKPDNKLPVDILLIIRTSDSSELLQEVRAQFIPDPSDKSDDTAKADKQPKPKDDAAHDNDKDDSDSIASQQIEQSITLSANGKIDEAVKLLEKVKNKLPDKVAQAKISISKNAAAFSGNAVAELDFDKAKHFTDVAMELDPSSDTAKAKDTEVRKWADAWKTASKLIPEFDDYLADDKVYSAEKTYMKINEIAGPIPAAPKTGPILSELSKKWAAARDNQTLRIQPHRQKIMEFIKNKAHANAIPLCKELLDGKVVNELYPVQEKEIRDWLTVCESKTEDKTASGKTDNNGDKPAGDSGKKPKKKKSLDDIIAGIDKISSDIDKIANGGKKPADTPKVDPKPPVSNQNPATSGTTTAGSTYSANSKGDVFNGGTWCNAKNKSDYLQRDFGGVRNVTGIYIKRAGTDVTTKGARILIKLLNVNDEWITIDDIKETNINWENLSFGGKGKSIPSYNKSLSPVIKAKAFKLELYGNGWFGADDIRITSTSDAFEMPPAVDNKPITDPIDDKKHEPKPDSVSVGAPLKPNPTVKAIPDGWVKKVLGEVTLYVPAIWKNIADLSGSEGAWYTGDQNEPDAGFGVMRQSMDSDLPDGMKVEQQADIIVSGLPGKSFIGKSISEDLIGWLILMKNPGKDGKPISFVGVAKTALWAKNKSILEKILATVKIGSAASKPAGTVKKPSAVKPVTPVAKPKTTPAAASLTVTATFINQASQNIHIFHEGSTFDPSNRLTPGESRKVNVPMTKDGRIKFIAGRSGTVITSKVWNGDPSDTNRVPKVIFTSDETLIITTMLK